MPAPLYPSTPGKAFQLGGQAYVYTDNKGTYAPAVQTGPGTYAPDQAKMAQMGMPQIGSKVASPEDDAALKTLVAGVEPARDLAKASQEFMDLKGGVHTGPQWGSLPVFGGDLQGANRKKLAVTDPKTESILEGLEAINSAHWPTLRPEGSGPIRVIEAQGWKSAFPSIVNTDQADAQINTRLNDTYADKSNAADYAQNYVHGGKGTVAAALATFENMKRTPSAKGRKQALGAAPGDFSGKAPGWSSALTPQQTAMVKMLAPTAQQFPPGHYNNPFTPTTPAEAAALYASHPGAYVINSDGRRIPIPK